MALVWLIGTPVLLVYRALTGPYSLLEPQPLTAARQAQQTALFDWGLVTSLAVPVVGAILALYTRHHRVCVGFAVVFVVSLVFWGFAVTSGPLFRPTHLPQAPVTYSRPIPCYSSGGSSDCPGG
ncbi:MAG TPA: hypothetical protein VFW65_20750, partial [Pseudonocardiaceae bacterium]|nr:hypothetical protein [Pseudonocardiaceae bacterium]